MNRFRLDLAQKNFCIAVSDQSPSRRQTAAMEFLQHYGEQAAFQFAHANELETVLVHSLGVEKNAGDWPETHSRQTGVMQAYLNELDRLANLLMGQGIPMVALKNGGIARGIYTCPGCCPMGDLDTLVEKKYFRQAHQILLEQGFHFEFRSPLEETEVAAAENSGGAEYWKILSNGEKLWFELQWRPVAGRWIRPDQEPPAEELMARSIPIPGTAVRLLAPEDNLMQVALHTAKHSYVRAPGFRLHLDVERIVRGQVIDWQVFLKRVETMRVKTAVYFSLLIPNELFDTPIPENVLVQLRPVRWKEKLITRMIYRAGLFNPHTKKFNRLEYILFNVLLYDDFQGVWRSLFPDISWMQQRYSIRHRWSYPYYYLRRLIDLALRRANT